jgi:hypothetical protein
MPLPLRLSTFIEYWVWSANLNLVMALVKVERPKAVLDSEINLIFSQSLDLKTAKHQHNLNSNNRVDAALTLHLHRGS